MSKIRNEKEVTMDCKNYRVIRKYSENLYSKLDKFLATDRLPKLHHKDENNLNIAIGIKAE